MNCRTSDETREADCSDAIEEISPSDGPKRCGACNSRGTRVSRKTILLMLKPHMLERAAGGSYSFCPQPTCSIVYFEDDGDEQFTVDELRLRVGLKVKDDPIPLCYCFGFDEKDLRDEIKRMGDTIIPSVVSRLIREGLCSCESRNPAGACCLGELNTAAKRLKLENAMTSRPLGRLN